MQIYMNAIRGYLDIDQNALTKSFHMKPARSGPILIHPFAGWSAKEWGLRHFIDLATELNKIMESKLICLRNALSIELKNEIQSANIELIETASIQDLLLQIEKAFLVVGNDSGIIYLANLLNVPTFTLFGPSNPAFHHLYSIYSDYIRKIIPCSPDKTEKLCFTNGGRDGCPSNECMKRLELEDVYNKITDLIKRLTANVA
jgi:heptosyltransferase-2